MAQREDIYKLVLDQLSTSPSLDAEERSHWRDHAGEKTYLFGSDGVFDSIRLVGFLLDVEEAVGLQYKRIGLMDDRAMSERTSPFLTVGTLTDHIHARLQES